ncbi:uncharacterized protein LOC144097127 [Amblyomma americanum]
MVRVWEVKESFDVDATDTSSESEQATDQSTETRDVSEDSDGIGDCLEQRSHLPEDKTLVPVTQDGVIGKTTWKKTRFFWIVLGAVRSLLVRKLFGGRSIRPTLVHVVTFLACFVAGTAGALFGVIVSVARPSRAGDIIDNWTIAKLEQVILAIARSASEKASLAAALVERNAADKAGRKGARILAIESR